MITTKELVTALLNNKKALELVAGDLQVSPESLAGSIRGESTHKEKKNIQNGKSIQIYIDGGARGNPGQGGAGVVLHYADGRAEGFYYYFDHITNNAAEYKALQYGLDLALSLKDYTSFHFFSDSQLLVRQINGEYKVKNAGLLEIYNECKQRIGKLPEFNITHVKRELNKNADRMANEAMDTKKMGKVELTDALE